MLRVKKDIDKNTALKKAREICGREEKCAYDIRKKFVDWGLDAQHHEALIDSLIQDSFIDESRYAKLFAESKIKYSHWGKFKISLELQRKHIPEKLIKEALETLIDANYEEIVKRELTKKLAQIKHSDTIKKKATLLRFAASRGYDCDMVYKYFKIFNDDT